MHCDRTYQHEGINVLVHAIVHLDLHVSVLSERSQTPTRNSLFSLILCHIILEIIKKTIIK